MQMEWLEIVRGVVMKFPEWFYCKRTFSVLRRVTFEALPLRSCALSPTMLPLLETFLELLLWNTFQCHHFFMASLSRNLCPFKAGFIVTSSQKSFGVKSVE
jgi:hypothetical protein